MTREIKEIKPYSKRSCTDILFLILFIGYWVSISFISEKAIDSGGNYRRLIFGVNMQGLICGHDIGYENKELAAWPAPGYFEPKICVSDCSETQTNSNIAVKHTSQRFLFYCIPVPGGLDKNATLSDMFTSKSQRFTRAVGDIYTGWAVILASSGVALILSFLYTMFLRRFAKLLVWGVVWALILAGTFASWSFLERSEDIKKSDVDEERAVWFQGAGYTFLGITVIFCIIVLGIRNRIQLAIAVVQEGARALQDMKLLVLFPIVTFLLACGYITYWVITALYIYSVANATNKDSPAIVTTGTSNPSTYVYYERDESFNNSLIYHFFGLLWVVQFLIYFTFMVLCGAVAEWYFSLSDSKGRKVRSIKTKRNKVATEQQEAWMDANPPTSHILSRTPIWDSCKRTIRFHLGTIAFGALIIAIINFIRAIVTYLQEKTSDRKNCLIKLLFCCVQCCLKCLHCCADKISKNALIWTAIWGDPFIPSASASFQLIWANLTRVAAINVITVYLMMLGKAMVALLTAAIAAFIYTRNSKYKEEMSSILLPVLCCFIVGYAVCSIFMTVFDTTIDTVFLCFLIDEDNNGNAMLAPKSLLKIINRYQKESSRIGSNMIKAISSSILAPDNPKQARRTKMQEFSNIDKIKNKK